MKFDEIYFLGLFFTSNQFDFSCRSNRELISSTTFVIDRRWRSIMNTLIKLNISMIAFNFVDSILIVRKFFQ